MVWNWGKFKDDDVDKSKFNAGALKITRLHDSWNFCRRKWRNGDARGVNEELDLIWLELEADATKDEHEEVNNIDKEIIKAIEERNLQVRRDKLFLTVKKKWFILFRIEKHQGLGKKYIDASDEELD